MRTKKLKSGDVFIYNENIEASINGITDDLLSEVDEIKNWGVITPLILTQEEKIFWHGGFIAPNLEMPMSYGAGEQYIKQYPGTRSVTTAVFECAIISKRLVKKMGLPDELGENAFFDANYCMHALAYGFKILATDKVKVKKYREIVENNVIAKFGQGLQEGALTFRRKWGATFRKHYRLPVCYHSRISAPTGFAVALAGYVRALSEAGIDVSYNYLHGAPETEPYPADYLLTAIKDSKEGMDMPQVLWGPAPLFFKNSGKYKIGHCEFEGDEFPRSWVQYCNMMDEIWVPTKWDRNKAVKAGVNKPIYIIYQGIDPDYYHPEIEPMIMPFEQKFKFICNAAWLPRKNLGNLLKTFARTFKMSESVCLVLKTINLGLVEDVKKEIEKLGIPDSTGWVYIKEEDWPTTHLPAFYTGGHCFVLPTRGEGWGLPIFEALACGVPVITTAYGAPNEILRDDEKKREPFPGVHFLDYNIARARTSYEYLKDGKWAEPNLNQLAEKMLYVYKNYQAEKAKALKTSEIIRDKFSWASCVKPIITRLEDIYKKGF